MKITRKKIGNTIMLVSSAFLFIGLGLDDRHLSTITQGVIISVFACVYFACLGLVATKEDK